MFPYFYNYYAIFGIIMGYNQALIKNQKNSEEFSCEHDTLRAKKKEHHAFNSQKK